MEKQDAVVSTLERILNSAETLFAASGYDGVSTRQIAAAAGISIQTLHYHCATKANLFLMVMERTILPLMELIDRGVQRVSGLDLSDEAAFLAAMDGVVEDIFEFLHAHPNYPPLYFRQYMEQDLMRMRVETDQVGPVLRQWAEKGSAVIHKAGKEPEDMLLLLLSLSHMYISLFVNSNFIGAMLEEDEHSASYLKRLKDFAKSMTRKMMGF